MSNPHSRSGLVTLCLKRHLLADHVLTDKLKAAYAELKMLVVTEVHVEKTGLVTLCVNYTDPHAVGSELRAVVVEGLIVTEVHNEGLFGEDE